MRKIIPQHVEEKNTRRKQVIVGVVLIGLMLLSTIGYAFQMIFGSAPSTDSNIINYKGFNFVPQNGLFVLSLNIGNFVFSYNPNEVKKIPGFVDRIEKYKGEKLYIYSEIPKAETEVKSNMWQIAGSIENACPQGIKCDSSIPVKTCDENFIIIKIGEEKISQEKNCVFIQGSESDLLSITDGFLLKILGIE